MALGTGRYHAGRPAASEACCLICGKMGYTFTYIFICLAHTIYVCNCIPVYKGNIFQDFHSQTVKRWAISLFSGLFDMSHSKCMLSTVPCCTDTHRWHLVFIWNAVQLPVHHWFWVTSVQQLLPVWYSTLLSTVACGRPLVSGLARLDHRSRGTWECPLSRSTIPRQTAPYFA